MGRNSKKRKVTVKKTQHSKKNGGSTIEMLNDDCLIHVLQYLPIKDRILSERGIPIIVYNCSYCFHKSECDVLKIKNFSNYNTYIIYTMINIKNASYIVIFN